MILALTSDEEGGSANGVDWLLKNHRVLIDAEFVLNGDAGGVYTEEGRPIAVEVAATEKLYADYQFAVTNTGGHSSLPVPDNAIYHLAGALSYLERSPFPFELNSVTRAYFERLAPHELKNGADMRAILRSPPDMAAVARLSTDPHYNSLMRTTCIPTRLNAGHANNALPQTAEAVVNCRILPGHSPEEIRKELAGKTQDPKVAIRYLGSIGGDKPMDHAPDKPGLPPVVPRPDVLKPLERIAAELWPGAPVVADMETGASDSKYTMAAGIPSFGIGEIALSTTIYGHTARTSACESIPTTRAWISSIDTCRP